MGADARPERRSLTPSPPMSRSSSPERPPRDAATPRFAQLDLITNDRTARVYVVPDHTWGETWPGRQKPTKQLSGSYGFAGSGEFAEGAGTDAAQFIARTQCALGARWARRRDERRGRGHMDLARMTLFVPMNSAARVWTARGVFGGAVVGTERCVY